MFQALPLSTQGRLSAGWFTQFWVTMSAEELLGPFTVVNIAPGAHQVEPRRSMPVPCTVSDIIKVVLVPSEMSVRRTSPMPTTPVTGFGTDGAAQPNGAPPNFRTTGVVMSIW